MKNICNPIRGSSMHIFNVFYRNGANNNGMGDVGKLGGKYKTFELTLI